VERQRETPDNYRRYCYVRPKLQEHTLTQAPKSKFFTMLENPDACPTLAEQLDDPLVDELEELLLKEAWTPGSSPAEPSED
jgi:hypothetical protein